MYWISGALSALRVAPPSSTISPRSLALPPVPTVSPAVFPAPRPPLSPIAMIIFPREGVRSLRGFPPLPEAPGSTGTGGAVFPAGAGFSPPRGVFIGASRVAPVGASLARGRGNFSSGGNAGLTGRSGTRPSMTREGLGGRASALERFSGFGGGGFGRPPWRIPGFGGRKSVARGRSARSTIITLSATREVQGTRAARAMITRCVRKERAMQIAMVLLSGITYYYNSTKNQRSVPPSSP